MKFFKRSIAIFCFIFIFHHVALSQNYLWPTDASRYLTSSFAEYRPGRLHAGIDIKTWGKTGYKVFAIRDGYISRIGVSPYGYGKVLYQQLDTGEIAVYAHLDRFNDKLQHYVKRQQREQGAYRININLRPDQFPVKRGELIAYSGDSGTGSAHLHFEIRDANNNPINPFVLGYRIEDKIPPTVKSLSITPLDCYSRVNGDAIPVIEKPVLTGPRNYKSASRPLVSGNVGFAIDCFDQADDMNHSFSVYQRNFYIDGALYFSAQYDKFSYDLNNLIDLDRDFRLMNRGKGQFQKLYKEKANRLSFYKPGGTEIGILRCGSNFENQADRLSRGEHQYVITLQDFFGNVTTISGSFIVGERKIIYADYQLKEPDQLFISNIRDQQQNRIEQPAIFVSLDQGNSWRKMVLQLVEPTYEAEMSPVVKYLVKPVKPGTLIKIQATDEYGIEFYPSYHFVSENIATENLLTDLKLEKDFYDDYIRFALKVQGFIRTAPKLLVQQIGSPATEVSLLQIRFNEFIGVYQVQPGKDGLLSVEANAIEPSGREITYWEQFDIQTVFPGRGGSISSRDGLCRVIFNPESVYKNLYLRMENLGPLNDLAYESIGEIYEVFPQDVPLKRDARLEIKYPANDHLPAKLGIYQLNQKKPGFKGNKIDFQTKTISCSISDLGAFTLLRDTIPPYIEIQRPGNKAQLSDKKPTLLATVFDELSGIASERSIIMRLDGQKLIAEFDPDARTIKFEPDEPLLPGEHSVSVWAVDNCNNETLVSQKFYILE